MLLTSVPCCSSVDAAKKKPESKAVRLQLDPGGCQGLGLAAPKLLRGCPPRPEGPEEQRNRGFHKMLGPFVELPQGQGFDSMSTYPCRAGAIRASSRL